MSNRRRWLRAVLLTWGSLYLAVAFIGKDALWLADMFEWDAVGRAFLLYMAVGTAVFCNLWLRIHRAIKGD